ncbi:HMG-Y-related protein A [Rhynchospora pubera]|uniref:HMG-Y-related protein A n=1 Tax=Rhynchospora pubera TaxID=906938 RepID=A0AAV8FZ92_9POAL|nr:HMG-Y-related protein A [Rhynchospora pubera]KAJ4820036.1 HMG-Y-related protein A [Rhynchospora pubera]
MADDGSASASPTGSVSGSPSPSPSPSPLPSYPELIKAAIAKIGGPNGSTKAAISDHIQASLSSGLPADHAALLSSHLASMSSSGELTFIDDLYSLPLIKRGRGRPPKPRLPGETGPRRTPSDGPRRPRGRPPKPRDPSAPEKVPRPRGRPPKSINGGSAEPTGEKKQRGRPPKVRPQFAEVGFV